MMRRSWKTGLVVAVAVVAVAFAGTAQATVVGSLLNEGFNTLNDNSRTVIVDMDLDDHLTQGDVIYGVYEIEKVNGSGDPSPGAIFAIFSAQITGFGNALLGPIATHGPTAVGTIDPTLTSPGLATPQIPTGSGLDVSLKGLLDPAFYDGSGPYLATAPALWGNATWDQAMIALLEIPIVTDAKNPYDPQYSDGDVPGPWDVSPDVAVIAPTLTAANGYRLDAIVGHVTAQDFMWALIGNGWMALDNPVVGGNGNGMVELSTELRSNNVAVHGLQVLQQRGAWSLLFEDIPEVMAWNQSTVVDYNFAPHTSDLVLVPDGAIQVAVDGSAGAWNVPNWDFTDDSNFEVNVTLIPEPGTIMVWSGLALLFSLVSVRRRKK